MKYTIGRMLGSELPPRDLPGSRIRSLQFVLENEPDLPNCRKIWVLNQIHQKSVKDAMVGLLKDHGQEFHELQFDRREYARQKTRDDKIRCAININKARNMIISLGSEFTFVFDGDCFFTPLLWQETIQELEADQSKQYYGVPCIRLTGSIPEDYRSMKKWEPMVVVRSDAEMRFDESLPFSKNDKVEFLRRLGYQREKGETALAGDLCKNIGCLLHISFSDEETETDLKTRMRLRDESIDRLLNQIAQFH